MLHARSTLLALMAFACGGAPSHPPPKLRSNSAHAARTERPSRPLKLEELSPERIRLDLNPSEMARCFSEPSPGKGASLARFAWEVDANGRVVRIELEESSLEDKVVEACLKDAVSSRNFGRPGEHKVGHWTFVSNLPKTRRNKHAGVLVEDPADWAERDSAPSVRRIEQAVNARFGLFAHCFRDAILKVPGLSGIARLRFTIGTDGKVSDVADAGSTFDDARVVPCMAEGFYAMEFPPPAEPLRVFYPLEFEGA